MAGRTGPKRREDLARRIERVYRALSTDPEHIKRRSRGQRWFARRHGWDETTVRCWLAGRRPMRAAALKQLERDEELVAKMSMGAESH